MPELVFLLPYRYGLQRVWGVEPVSGAISDAMPILVLELA